MKTPAFQFYPADWLTSARVTMMSLEAEGMYIRAICYCWLHGSVPADPEKFSRLLSKGGSTTLAREVQAMFNQDPTDPEKLRHERLDAEREKQKAWREKSADGGRKSGKSRNSRHLETDKTPESESKGGSRVVEGWLNQKATLQSSSSSSSSEVVEREREGPDCAHRPSEKEVIAYASIIGLAEWRAIDWWREMEGCGWLDYLHKPIARWQPILARVRAKWEADGRPTTPPVNKYAANGTTGKASRPHSLLDLKTIIGANQAAADKLKLQFCSESALGDQWTREDKWKEWKEIRGKIKQLNTQIASLG